GGGEITRSYELRGAPQILIAFNGAAIIMRGQRTGEQAGKKNGQQWGGGHFGFPVQDDFDGFFNGLKRKGGPFSTHPPDFNPTTRIAFIGGPDRVNIELVPRK